MLNKKSLLNRTLVGVGIFAVMITMILLNVYFPNYINGTSTAFFSGRGINSVLISAIMLLAVIEMRRALGKEHIPDCFSWLLWMYGIGIGPSYMLFGYTGIIFFTLVLFMFAVVTAMFHNRADSIIYIAFMFVYPGLFMATMLYINRSAATRPTTELMKQFVETDIWQFITNRTTSELLPLNAIGLSFIFAVASFTDIFAYFVGSLCGKHKLCPQISPKKTVEGAVGGLFGGCVASFVIFLVFDYFKIFGEQFGLTYAGLQLPPLLVVLTYVSIGVLGSMATQIGDLLASMIKRYCEIKDYSRILGEHGGIMDRFDGIMLNSVLVSFVFMFIL